jgi:hypothetical protein
MMKDALRNLNRAARILLFPVVLVLLAGCGVHKPFELFDETTVIKNSTVAVISTDGSEATMWLAEALTKELKSRSTLKVFSQAKIGLRVGKYPVTIKKGKAASPDKPDWLGKRSKTKVKAMEKHLKAKYLFVVWTELTPTSTSEAIDVRVNANVVEYPKGQVIGYSFFSGRKSNRDGVNKMLADSAVMIAEKFAQAAKAEKQGKIGK